MTGGAADPSYGVGSLDAMTGTITQAEVDDGDLVLPWWFSWWRVAAITALATLALVGGIGLLARSKAPGAGSADVGFLQDMRSHHDQAVLMANIYLDRPGTDQVLRTMAGEVLIGQAFETGQMVEILRGWRAEEENSSGFAMSWMGHDGMPIAEMPGMATDEQLDRLQSAEGADADALFVDLMNAHHRGGIEMADAAVARASSGRVKQLAAAFSRNQTVEIEEMTAALAKARAAA